MIGYFGTNNLERSTSFYDEVLGAVGGKRVAEADRYVAWSISSDLPEFILTKTYDGEPANPGNGNMLALLLDDIEKVRLVYSKALELGAHDEGQPAERAAGGFRAYFRDLDGNKFGAFYFPE
ncbi:VOC family protein [Pseudovibrio denitrificans]|uniref:VOC family protein n=1 Tax=Pseudovibrio denitrificans TaxID=258256 RepID=UPI0039BF8AE3